MQAKPQARGLRPTLSEPIIRDISPGSEMAALEITTTIPAIKAYPIKKIIQIISNITSIIFPSLNIPMIPDLATDPIA